MIRTICVVPKKAIDGVHAKVVARGGAREVPLAGVNVAPVGRLVTVMVRLPATGLVPVTVAENGCPTGAVKVPDPVHTGGACDEISMITSRVVRLTTPAWVLSPTKGRMKRCPLTARVRSHSSTQPPFTGRRVGLAPPRGIDGICVVSADSPVVAKRQVVGSRSGSKTGMKYERTAPSDSETMAGVVVTGPPVFPPARDTVVSTRKLASEFCVSPLIQQQPEKKTVNGPLVA